MCFISEILNFKSICAVAMVHIMDISIDVADVVMTVIGTLIRQWRFLNRVYLVLLNPYVKPYRRDVEVEVNRKFSTISLKYVKKTLKSSTIRRFSNKIDNPATQQS